MFLFLFLKTKIKNHLMYRIVHTKMFLVDFSQVFFPVLRSSTTSPAVLEDYFENVLKTMFIIKTRLGQSVGLELINSDVLFNSLLVYKQLTLAFIRLMSQFEFDDRKSQEYKQFIWFFLSLKLKNYKRFLLLFCLFLLSSQTKKISKFLAEITEYVQSD